MIDCKCVIFRYSPTIYALHHPFRLRAPALGVLGERGGQHWRSSAGGPGGKFGDREDFDRTLGKLATIVTLRVANDAGPRQGRRKRATGPEAEAAERMHP